MHLYPICMMRQWNQSLQMHVNSFNAGHTILHWKKNGSDIENELELTSSMVTLNSFESEATYWFWTVGDDGTESRRMRVHILAESPSKIIERILSYSNVEQKERWAIIIINRLKRDFSEHPETPIIDYLRSYMDETDDLQDYERIFYYELMYIAERYHNMLNIAMNSSLEVYPTITYSGKFKLKTKEDVGRIRLYSVTSSGELNYLPSIIKEATDFTDTLAISLKEGTLNRIIPMSADDEDNWLNYFIHYQYDEDRTSELWQDDVDALDKLDQIMTDDAELAMSDIDMSSEDKENWKLEQAKEPYDFIVPRPTIISANPDSAFCTIGIPNWGLLKASGKQFYLSNRESDLLLRDDFDNLTPIVNSEVIVDRAGKYVDGNQFFYIQAENGNIISRLTRQDFLASEPEEYREKARLVQFNIYEKRLRSTVRYYLPSAENYIVDLLAKFRTDDSADIDEIYLYLLAEIPRTYEDRDNADKLMFVILEDWNSNFNVKTDFFAEYPKYYYATDTFVFPPSKNDYLLCVGSIDFNTDKAIPTMSYYASSKYQSIQLQTRSLKYYFMYAIDLTNFKRSGFLFVDTYNHTDPIVYRSGIIYERM